MKKMNLFNIMAIAAMSMITVVLNGAAPVGKEQTAEQYQKELIYLKHIAEEKGLTSAVTEPIKEYLKHKFVSIKIVNHANTLLRLDFVDHNDRVVAHTQTLEPCRPKQNCGQTVHIPVFPVKMVVYEVEDTYGYSRPPKMTRLGSEKLSQYELNKYVTIDIQSRRHFNVIDNEGESENLFIMPD